MMYMLFFFFFQAEDGIRDVAVTGVQTCALPISFENLLYLALPLALILVYMVMAAQFKSLVDPFIIMFSIPMGFPGVIVMLFLTGTTLSITSFMGVIMLLGIVVSNGVLLVDYTNVLRRRGIELHEAVVK